MQYEIQDKTFINAQGDKVNYKRLVITGYLAGNLQEVELPISKDQAVIYNAMKADAPRVDTYKGGNVDVERKQTTILDDEPDEGRSKAVWDNE